MRIFVLLVAAIFLVVAAGCGATPEVSPAPVAKTFPAGPAVGDPPPVPDEAPNLTWFQMSGPSGVFDARIASRIVIDNPLGDIAVVPGQYETIAVTIRLHALGRDDAEARSRTQDVSLGTSVEESEFWVTVRGGDDRTFAALEITVPPDRDLTLDARAGKATVEGIEADVSIAGTLGDITVTDVRGPLDIHAETATVTARGITEAATVYTSSGKIELTDIAGPVIARTMTGAIRLVTTSNEIIANTQGGDIDLLVTRPFDGSLEARTDGGHIEIRLSSSSNCRLATRTRSGDITSELSLEEVTRNGPNISGCLGAGKGSLLATTNSGNILLAPVE